MSRLQLFYVVGMHRSGTSATTRVLNLLGLSVGPEEDLLPASPNNPRGFWEQTQVMAFNDRLLGALGGRWDQPPPTPDGWHLTAAADDWAAEARALLQGLRMTSQSAVVKDPRFALTLPLWERAEPAARVVLAVRDPRAVSQSLARRNSMDPSLAAALWLRYTGEALRNVRSPVVVDYRDLTRAPLAVARRLSEELSLTPPTGETEGALLDFVDASLNHEAPISDRPGCAELDRACAVYELVRAGDLSAAGESLSAPR